jgi:hypothetical protein
MAYLNVRERRIEAKIAYVGGDLAGKATNFDQLKLATNDARIGKIETTTTDDGVRLSLAWQPPESRFRDCDVLVSIVAEHGAMSTDRFANVLREADGVVVVVDAHPSAHARNLASLTTVRDVMARAESRNVPIVIQINKTDLPDALAADDVVGALDAQDFTHVIAAAARGEGVIETLEAALNEVLSSMQTELNQHEDGTPPTVRPAAANGATAQSPGADAARSGGHPLLAALRQVLRETVREHVDELETRVSARLEASLTRIEQRISATERNIESLVSHASTLASKDDVSSVGGRLDRVRDDVKTELVRTLEARARADREYLATATGNLKKAIDATSGEMRTFDVRGRVSEVIEHVTALEGRTELVSSSVDAASAALDAVSQRLEHIELSGRRTAKLDDAVRGLRTDVSEAFAATSEKTEAVHARVNEIVEELKKPKKGWFT